MIFVNQFGVTIGWKWWILEWEWERKNMVVRERTRLPNEEEEDEWDIKHKSGWPLFTNRITGFVQLVNFTKAVYRISLSSCPIFVQWVNIKQTSFLFL